MKALHGMSVRLERASDMRNNFCTSLAVIRIEDGSDKAELRCAICGRYRGRLSAKMAEWMLTLLQVFPAVKEQPLIVRDATYAFEDATDDIDNGADPLDLRERRARKDNVSSAVS
jgi:hypothetical protein